MFSKFVILTAILRLHASVAQHGHDPFEGSNCTCETFCDNKCSIRPTAPMNLTLYRMTPLHVDTCTDKNTGDASGDTSYVLSRRTAAAQCAHDPSSWQCATLVVKGDEANSTDLIIEFTIEVDGKWGPYLYCNPVDAKHPEKEWNCTATLHINGGGNPPNYPAQCSAGNYSGHEGYCYTNTPSKVLHDVDLAECCTEAGKGGEKNGAYGYTYIAKTRTCNLFYSYRNRAEKCDDGITGIWEYPEPKACDCPRIHASVGRENLTSSRSYHVAGGEWYSHPHQGECKEGQSIHDGTCSWRVVETTKAVNATCVYDRIDTLVESKDPSCFSRCPKIPSGAYNRTTDCYSNCYKYASEGMTEEEVVQPWKKAFSSENPEEGGCPRATIPN